MKFRRYAGPAAPPVRRARCWQTATAGRGSTILIGTAAQITDNFERLKETGLSMPLIWPPFTDVPVSKTLDHLKQLKEEILPQVEAM